VTDAALRRHWAGTIGAVLSTVDAAGMADRVGEDLVARWSEPHRHYHTLAHLGAVVSIVDSTAAAVGADGPVVALAAWFHDAVYDPRRDDNEEASARLAGTALARLGRPAAQVAEVARLVRLTATHDPEPGDRNGALLCDADLAILAADPPAYDRYSAAVRREYPHVPDDAFRAGRAAVLRRLRDRPALFHVVAHRADWEARARANLSRELAALTG
jgi:predicted metal-dependent HD superfamily phosphohydrolase